MKRFVVTMMVALVAGGATAISSGCSQKTSPVKVTEDLGAVRTGGSISYASGALPISPSVTITKSNPAALLCNALKGYPKREGEKLSFESGEISQVCRPFIKMQRSDLDRCGDLRRDPYSVNSLNPINSAVPVNSINPANSATVSKASSSNFTWASRNEMIRKGKTNLYTDPEFQPQLDVLLRRVGELRLAATDLCCGSGDVTCRTAMGKVDVEICKPVSDPDAPDPCVFGGSYKMSGSGYTSMFKSIHGRYATEANSEFKRIAAKNLRAGDLRLPAALSDIVSGNIVLSSYVSRSTGAASLEPIILHEFGHACTMIKMQQVSLTGGSAETNEKALRATEWLDRARSRCNQQVELPQAYYDFWESIGETRGLASCLFGLTGANQKQAIDRPCAGLCPGHYLEESVGVAFSLLLGGMGEGTGANGGVIGGAFPNTCDHVRDGQHPMVSDIAECMAQHSPRFRDRLKTAFKCDANEPASRATSL